MQTPEHFNLVTDNWIKIRENNQIKEVSLKYLFLNSNQIKKLDNDSPVQNLVILRLILAIATTVYQREINQKDCSADNLWQQLYKDHEFHDILLYLNQYKDEFDFFGKHPFAQVTAEQFCYLLTETKSVNKKILKKGNLIISTLNRNINQSASPSGLNPFSPVTNSEKDQMKLTELIRWILTYQQVAGSSDKVKIKSTKPYSAFAGQLLVINPIYLTGSNLTETIVLNLVLQNKDSSTDPKPVWEQNPLNYIKSRTNAIQNRMTLPPDNIAELYSSWSRAIYIDYSDLNPEVHVITLPAFDNRNNFTEQMTNYRIITHKDKTDLIPATIDKNHLKQTMWQKFGTYLNSEEDGTKLPGVINWIHHLQDQNILPYDFQLNLSQTATIQDGSASQKPIAEINDSLNLNASVAFSGFVPLIETAIEKLQQTGKLLYSFGKTVDTFHNQKNVASQQFLADFNDSLNQPFKDWLSDLKPETDIVEAIDELYHTGFKLSKNVINNYLQTYTSFTDFKTDTKNKNLIDYENIILDKIYNLLFKK